MSRVFRWCAALGLAGLLAPSVGAEEVWSPAAAVDRAIAAAESSLQRQDLASADRKYREALFEGWRLTGALERLEGRRPEAREAYRSALPFAGETAPALQSLAFGLLRTGAPDQAADILAGLAEKDPGDVESLRLLAMALAAGGEFEQAVQRLDEASGTGPDDPQQLFLLATEYLWLKRADRAERLFAQVIKARPIPQTHVLIGRAYRDAGEYERARVQLRAALSQDPGVRRAHYYLGMVILTEGATDPTRRQVAEAEFRAELEIAPQDPLTNHQLGLVLLDAGHPTEALPFLETAVREEARSGHLHDLGRCQLALDRLAEGTATSRRALETAGEEEARSGHLHDLGRCQLALDLLTEGTATSRRALETAREEEAGDEELERIHYQLGRALRMLGQKEEAATHLGEAGRLRARRRDASREETDPSRSEAAAQWPLGEASALSGLTPPQRSELRRRVTAGLARAYFNLAVLEAQSTSVADATERFARAAALFERAADVDPDFPQVQSSLGVAYFNARRFDDAIAPLTRAVAADPANAGLKRMLALSTLNAHAWAEAARLLQDDPGLESDRSLQSAYALALVRSRRGAEAETVLTRLLAQHDDSAELRVLLGQAYAQQEKYDAARESLERALRLDPNVAEAHRTLGVVSLRQGRLAEAEQALRTELEALPSDARSQLDLAAVLDAQGRPEEAVALLRGVLETQPESAEALYLLGRMLLAQGAATEAVEHLEAAARLTPEDANVRYQLGQAYQRLGRAELARRELEASRKLGARP